MGIKITKNCCCMTFGSSARTIDDYNRYIIELVSANDVRVGFYKIDYVFLTKILFPFNNVWVIWYQNDGIPEPNLSVAQPKVLLCAGEIY